MATTRDDQQNQDQKGHVQGAVKHPDTDGRLKGNEANRPNDPDGSARAEGGRTGGQHSHDNDGKRKDD